MTVSGTTEAFIALTLALAWTAALTRRLRRRADRALAEERARGERRAEALRAEAHAVLDQAPDPILQHDLEGRLRDVNQAALAVFGYPRAEMLKLTLFDLAISLPRGPTLARWRAMAPGQRLTLRTEARRQDGDSFPAEISAAMLAQADGGLSLTVLLRDISSDEERTITLQRTVEELYQANSRTETAITAKNRFLETVSSRLRSPLNVILAMAENPRQEPQPALERIHAEAGALMTVIDDLSSAATMEAAVANAPLDDHAIMEMSPDAVLQCRDGLIAYINSAGVRLLGGLDRDQFEGRPLSAIVPPEHHGLLADDCAALLDKPGATELRLKTLPGDLVDVSLSTAPTPDGAILMVARNISDMLRAKRDIAAHSKRLNSILDTAVDAIVVCDETGVIETFNRAAERMFGFSAEEAIGANVTLLMTEDDARQHDEHLTRYLHEKSPHVVGIGREVTARRKDGGTFPVEISLSVCELDDRRLFTAILRDIAERRSFEEHLTHFATHDTLTSLPNRHLFQSTLQVAMDKAKSNGGHVSVWFLDLDGFKTVNDVMGHAAGDELMIDAGLRLLELMGPEDTVARFGGDEFVLLRHGLETPAAQEAAAADFITRMGRPFALRGREVALSTNLGIACYPEHAHSVSDLVAAAGAAMMVAKGSGRNHYRFFDQQMQISSAERLTLENELRRAITRNELVLHYQPQVDAQTGAIVGLEALVRWNHPQQGLIMPGRFIPVAEQTGLIVPLGEWVLRQACADLKRLEDSGCGDVSVAVNISPRQFADADVLGQISKAIADTGIDPFRLDVEITESVLMNDPERILAYLDQMKDLGIRLSIDDFGTGYSSLNYLKRFPVDTLKIDRSFVIDIADSPKDEAIAVTIITLAHAMGMTVLAEGVEHDRQGDLLSRLGCDVIQGFLYSRPKPFEVVAGYLTSGARLPVET
ncbi:cyclic di-GMP phosphodiesterase Gmr [mine drainage metagenome]|uniref:Cyclic di-GMP phosphodiesterase Gmr n=1 Tax=mine drainage metagenome TaxID=410659 RepID=A0A1J5S2F0_9ZZZZ